MPSTLAIICFIVWFGILIGYGLNHFAEQRRLRRHWKDSRRIDRD